MSRSPSPWTAIKLRTDDFYSWSIEDKDGRPVCEEAEEDDAHLIASAPEMLECLEELIASMHIVSEGTMRNEIKLGDKTAARILCARARARAAIAKAKGEAS